MNKKPYEYEIEIAGFKIKNYHGVIYIDGNELNFTDKLESKINRIFIEILDKEFKKEQRKIKKENS